MVRALDFYLGRLCSNPTIGRKYFQLGFIPVLWLLCRKMGLVRDQTLLCWKWLCVIINDDFLEKGGMLQPTFFYLPWQISHSLYVYIQSLTTESESRLFGSVVRALDFYPGRPCSNPTIGGKFFQLCFIPLLQLSCHKMLAHWGSDFTLLKMASHHYKWWLPWKGGVLQPSTPTFNNLPWQITHSL